MSNTIETAFSIDALNEALARQGRPGIFNTDEGTQFTSPRFTDVLKDANVRISMDGRSRWMDNVFIERLWRSLRYQCAYLHACKTDSELRAGLTQWIGYYNTQRPHFVLAGRTPDEAYRAAGIGNWRPYDNQNKAQRHTDPVQRNRTTSELVEEDPADEEH